MFEYKGLTMLGTCRDSEDSEDSRDQPVVCARSQHREPAWPHVTRCGEGQIKVKEARACGLGLKEGN